MKSAKVGRNLQLTLSSSFSKLLSHPMTRACTKLPSAHYPSSLTSFTLKWVNKLNIGLLLVQMDPRFQQAYFQAWARRCLELWNTCMPRS